MIIEKKYKLCFSTEKDFNISFKLKFLKISDKKDVNFPYPDEIFYITTGEEGKFGAESIFQTKLTALKTEKGILFNGYSPDFGRRSHILKKGNRDWSFCVGQTYKISIKITQYRVYIDIDDGFISTSYANYRVTLKDMMFFVRDGTEVDIEDISWHISEPFSCPFPTVDEMAEKGIITNYLYRHSDSSGVYFERMSITQNMIGTTRNFGCYQTGVAIDMYTDSKEVTLSFKVCDYPADNWTTGFGYILNGEIQPFRPFGSHRDEVYTKSFKIRSRKRINRVTIMFPPSVCLALSSVRLSKNASFYPVRKTGKALFIGDSITEGSECFDPCAVYANQVSFRYNFEMLNQSFGGMTFNRMNVDDTYRTAFDYVFIAYGTNSYCGGKGNKEERLAELERLMVFSINKIKMLFQNAQIIALLPIWRSDENGPDFSLRDISERMKEVYRRYPDIKVIDCYGFLPKDFSLFSDPAFAIHPNSRGHYLYGKKLMSELKKLI